MIDRAHACDVDACASRRFYRAAAIRRGLISAPQFFAKLMHLKLSKHPSCDLPRSTLPICCRQRGLPLCQLPLC